MASSYTDVYDNVVSDATVRHDIEAYWPAGNPIGVDNVVHDNCLWHGREGAIGAAARGLRAAHNARVNPQFVNGRVHDYRLKPTSPCLFAVGDVEAAVDGVAATIPLIKHTPFAASFRSAHARSASRRRRAS